MRNAAHNIEAEQSVLGACLQDASAVDRVSTLQPRHFFLEAHQYVFESILDALEEGTVVDPLTIGQRLEDRDLLKHVGGLAYLVELTGSVPSAANASSYAAIVLEKAKERALHAAVVGIQERLGYAGSASEKIDFAQSAVMSLTADKAAVAPRVGDLRGEFMALMDQRASGQIVGTSTGFADLDGMLGGLGRGNLMILAPRPSMGKSSLAFQIGRHVARRGQAVLCFTMEMTALEVHDRLVAWESGMPLGAVTSGRPTGTGHVKAALDHMQGWPMLLDDSPALTVREIRARSRAAHRRTPLSLVIVDYLQLMQGEGDTRNTQIESISRGLKALAKELDVPVIALSQLSRKCDDRPDHRPLLSDLRDSGGIEQDADVVVMIYREEVYRPNAGEWKGCAELLVRKNRQGPTGEIRMTWRGTHAAFAPFTGDWPDTSGSIRLTPRRVAFDG